MKEVNVSPWINEIEERPPIGRYDGSGETDVIIIGGGIAGMSTAYYLMTRTELNVTLLERDRIGYGSSGRNGGQGVASMERSFADMLRTMEATAIVSELHALESGYWHLRELCQEVEYDAGPYDTVVWCGLSSVDEVEKYLEEMELRRRYGAPLRALVIAKEHLAETMVPNELRGLVSTQNASSLQLRLNTKERYRAAYPIPVSLVNSGRLCGFIHKHLVDNFPGRYRAFEGRMVHRIELGSRATVSSGQQRLECNDLVLCTNGYRPPEIVADHVPAVTKTLRRFVASMVAYERKVRSPPAAYIYYHEEGDPEEEPYFYLTRRPYRVTGDDLIAVGGPQTIIDEDIDHDKEYPSEVYDRIHGFVERSYPEDVGASPSMRWNGLMGYTTDGLRLVGPDPNLQGLWYNLGCNGVGLLSSIVGARQLTGLIKRKSS